MAKLFPSPSLRQGDVSDGSLTHKDGLMKPPNQTEAARPVSQAALGNYVYNLHRKRTAA